MRIELTPKAVTKVKEIMAQQNPAPAGLRVAVMGGGCSGFSYQMNFENQTNGVDKIYEFDGLKVFVDQASLMYINGTIPMPGGSGQGYSTWASQKKLSYYEGMDSATYFKYMEEGKDSQGEATMALTDPNTGKAVDLSKQSTATDAEKNAQFTKVSNSMDAWKKGVEAENKNDDFISFAWSRNGPVDTLARLTFWAVFFSLFSIIGTIAAIRSLSITFGGDIEIAGLTRLI